MKSILTAATALLLASALHAEVKGTLVFEDDFERSEADDSKEEIGKGWGSNSKKRANGNKQVDLKDGAMHITFHPSADHAVSVTHPAEFRDGSIQLRFMLPTAKDSLGLDLADMTLKEVHAGHLFIARISTTNIQLIDHKTGGMNKTFYEAKKAKTLTKEQLAELKTKTMRTPHKLQPGTWYSLNLQMVGDTLSVSIDGKKAAQFSSPGFAHPTKRLLRLSVPKKAVIDDLKIYALPS